MTTTPFSRAICCPPSASYADGLTTAGLGRPDLSVARAQHAAYCAALRDAGIEVTTLPGDDAHPDATFVEDTAIVTARGAICCHPGAASRRGEVATMQRALTTMLGSAPAMIIAPGTVDGGDVCQIGDHFCIGLSGRTNTAGAAQLGAWLAGLGYTASTVPLDNDPQLLHLKSGLTWLGGDRVLAVASLATRAELAEFDVTVVPEAERYAANGVRVNDVVLLPAGHPETAALVSAIGYRVVPLAMSEFQKMDGGLSCLSIRVPR